MTTPTLIDNVTKSVRQMQAWLSGRSETHDWFFTLTICVDGAINVTLLPDLPHYVASVRPHLSRVIVKGSMTKDDVEPTARLLIQTAARPPDVTVATMTGELR